MKDAPVWPVVPAATAKYALATAGATPEHDEEEVEDAAEVEEEGSQAAFQRAIRIRVSGRQVVI